MVITRQGRVASQKVKISLDVSLLSLTSAGPLIMDNATNYSFCTNCILPILSLSLSVHVISICSLQ